MSKLSFPVAFALLFFSCSTVHSVDTDAKPLINRYSFDKLPLNWKKSTTLKAIDDILPVAITQLKNTRSCMNCKAGFWVTVQLDSLFIIDEAPRDNTGWYPERTKYNDVVTCTFRFKSHLSISDSTGKEVVRLVVVDPQEDIYTITASPYRHAHSSLFNLKDYNGFGNNDNDKGILAHPLVPTDDELLDFTRQKLKVIQRRIQKLQDTNG